MRETALPSHPGGLLPGCQERRPRRDKVARPFRSLQARGFASGMEARRAETAPLAPFTTARPASGTPGKP